MNKIIYYIVAIMIGIMSNQAAAETRFTYAQPDNELISYGFGKAQTYDVAISLDNPGFRGMTISSVCVPLVPTTTDDVSGLRFFVTNELRTVNIEGSTQNSADIVWNAEYPTEANSDDGYCWYTFELPVEYEIGEKPVYIGYEFNVSKVNSNNKATSEPLVLSQPGIAGGLWLRCSRSVQKWSDLSLAYDAVSAMTVTLGGEIDGNAVTVTTIDNYMAVVNEAGTVNATVINMCSSQIRAIGYTVTLGDNSEHYNTVLSEPIPAVLGATANISINVPAATKYGQQPLSVAMDMVNNEPNTSAVNSVSGTATILPFKPVASPVYEEFTGTDCMWCPRGIASMEYMRETYGSDFHVAVWHSGKGLDDPMWPASGYPQISVGAPSGYMNRIEPADPYYGRNALSSTYGFESLWLEYTQRLYPADVNVVASFDNDRPDNINVTCDVHWAYIPDTQAEYRMEYILVGDGLHGAPDDLRWLQYNNYNNAANAEGMAHMERFIGAGSVVFGLEFNDVALLSSRIGGMPGSVGTPVVDGHSTDSYTFDTTAAVNNAGELIPFDPTKLRVVALLLKAGGTAGTVVASGESHVAGNSDIRDINAEKHIVSEEYYDLSGRKLTGTNRHGYAPLIHRIKYSDGTFSTNKIF